MSTCYDCAYGKIIDNGVNRGYICDLGEKTFYVPFMAPTPEICDKFAKKSGISAWDAFNDEERKKYSEMYSILPFCNPDVSAEDFFRDMDSGYLGIYPENTPDIVKAIDSIKAHDEDVIKTVANDAEELQKTKPMEPDELSEETKFRIYKLIVNEIGKHFHNCEMSMSFKDFILVEDCIRKVLQGEQDEQKTN